MRRRGLARLIPGLWTEAELLGPTAPGLVPSRDDLRQRLRPAGSQPVEPGDVLVFSAGLGAGTVTDLGALGLALADVGGLLAPSADGAFRDACLHAGVPLLVVPNLAGAIGDGDDLTVDFATGTIEDVTRRRMLVATPLSSAELRLLRVAPSLAWYGIRPSPPDPDVVETVTVPPNDY